MKTIRLTEPGHFEVIDSPDPGDPGPGEVRARVRHIGLCGTDLHAYRGRQPFFTYPRVLGHELGVEIESIGEGVEHLQPGMTAAVEPYLRQPGGAAFRRGKTNCSESTQCLGVHCDGGMTEFLRLPAQYFHPAPLPTRSLALVETLCIGHHAVTRARVMGDEWVAVIGLGPIGLGVAQFARDQGVEVVAIDVDKKRLERAESLVPGIKPLLRSIEEPVAAVWDAACAERPEIVWDCTGRADSMEASFELACAGGSVVLVGLTQGPLSFDDPSLHRRELSIISSRNAVASDFKSVIAAMEAGRVKVESWITHEAPAEQLPERIEPWLQPQEAMLKGMIHF